MGEHIRFDAGDLLLRLLMELELLVLQHVRVEEFFELFDCSIVLPALLAAELLDELVLVVVSSAESVLAVSRRRLPEPLRIAGVLASGAWLVHTRITYGAFGRFHLVLMARQFLIGHQLTVLQLMVLHVFLYFSVPTQLHRTFKFFQSPRIKLRGSPSMARRVSASIQRLSLTGPGLLPVRISAQ